MSLGIRNCRRSKLRPDEITAVLYRVCIQGEPIVSVALSLGVYSTTVEQWVNRYEERT